MPSGMIGGMRDHRITDDSAPEFTSTVVEQKRRSQLYALLSTLRNNGGVDDASAAGLFS
jgi:hypothetical protein